MSARPQFDDLPLAQGDPKASAWGLYGKEDELGTLNLLTPEVVQQAAAEVKKGIRIPLNLTLDGFRRPMNPARKPCEHNILVKPTHNDDEISINTQGSSQWDGLRHYPYQDGLRYYNGVTQEEISGTRRGPKIGIQNIAQAGIVSRGVLLDWCRYAEQKGSKYSPFDRHPIRLSELKEIASQANIEFRAGDILLIRTGWLKAYQQLSNEHKDMLPDREMRTSCGVEATEESIRWHWDNAFAAVATDTVAYEAWPSPKAWGVSMHEVFLSGWGMPIGESWDLEELSRACVEQNRWTFMLTSQPLNLVNGVASPPNAMAIM